MERLRALILGCGGVSRHYGAASITDAAPIHIAGCFDRDRQKAEAFSAGFGVRAFLSEEELLADEAQFVCVLTPNPFHVANVLSAIHTGHDVLCEHPLCVDPSDLQMIINESQKCRRTVFVMRQRRFSRSAQFLKKLIETNALGRVRRCRGSVIWSRNAEYYASRPWQREAHYGGVTLNQASHFLDLFCYLFGPGKVIASVRGNIGREMPAEDAVSVSIQFNEAAADLFATTSAEDGYNDGLLEVTFDEGTVYCLGKEWDTVAMSPALRKVSDFPSMQWWSRFRGDHQDYLNLLRLWLQGREGGEAVTALDADSSVRLLSDVRNGWTMNTAQLTDALAASRQRLEWVRRKQARRGERSTEGCLIAV